MASEIIGERMVWTKSPTTGNRIDFGYSTPKEAKDQAIAVERSEYEILEILPTSQAAPSRPTGG